MSYTDKEMQISTQIAYMNITQDQINGYLKDHNGEYPTIQEIPVCKDNQTYNTRDRKSTRLNSSHRV